MMAAKYFIFHKFVRLGFSKNYQREKVVKSPNIGSLKTNQQRISRGGVFNDAYAIYF